MASSSTFRFLASSLTAGNVTLHPLDVSDLDLFLSEAASFAYGSRDHPWQRQVGTSASLSLFH